jgi:hypothetical protein
MWVVDWAEACGFSVEGDMIGGLKSWLPGAGEAEGRFDWSKANAFGEMMVLDVILLRLVCWAAGWGSLGGHFENSKTCMWFFSMDEWVW